LSETSPVPPPTDPRLVDAEVQTKIAEAEKSLAEARKERAQARKLAAECAEAVAHARTARCHARQSEMELAECEETHRAFCLSDHHFRVYRFSGDVNAKSVDQCVAMMTFWSRADPGCDMQLEIMSGGGQIVAGMALYDYICSLAGNGHKVTTVARGWAASMAAILLQAGTRRIMGKQASLLIHEASFGAEGKTGDVKDTVAWIEQLQKHITDIFVTRSDGKISKATFTKNWKRKDWWIDAETALRYGFVDEIR